MAKPAERGVRRKLLRVAYVLIIASAVAIAAYSVMRVVDEGRNEPSRPFTDSFDLQACTFNTTGENRYFVLQPRFRLVLDGVEAGDDLHLEITILNTTTIVDGVTTRVVLENMTVNGEIEEISLNYVAICEETGSVVYFGEDVDIYLANGTIVHDGSWRAGGSNRAGLLMPGTILLGGRYYQEVAPGIAEDRAEIMNDEATLVTTAGTFTGCLVTEETTPLEPDSVGYKTYAPGIGLVKDGILLLTEYGYI